MQKYNYFETQQKDHGVLAILDSNAFAICNDCLMSVCQETHLIPQMSKVFVILRTISATELTQMLNDKSHFVTKLQFKA